MSGESRNPYETSTATMQSLPSVNANWPAKFRPTHKFTNLKSSVKEDLNCDPQVFPLVTSEWFAISRPSLRYNYCLEALCHRRPQQCHFISQPSVTIKCSASLRMSPEHNFYDSKSSSSHKILTVTLQPLSPSGTTEWHAILLLSHECNSTDSKNCVSQETSTVAVQSLSSPLVPPLSDMPFQHCLLSTTPPTLRALYPRRPQQWPCHQPVSSPSRLPLPGSVHFLVALSFTFHIHCLAFHFVSHVSD